MSSAYPRSAPASKVSATEPAVPTGAEAATPGVVCSAAVGEAAEPPGDADTPVGAGVALFGAGVLVALGAACGACVGAGVARARTAVGTPAAAGAPAVGLAWAVGCLALPPATGVAVRAWRTTVGVTSAGRAPSGRENPSDRATSTATAITSSRPRPSHGIPPLPAPRGERAVRARALGAPVEGPPVLLPRGGRALRPRPCATLAEYRCAIGVTRA